MLNKFRSSKVLQYIVLGVIGLIHLYAVIQMFFNDDFLEIFNRLRMFTNLSNILAGLGVLFYVLKLDSKPFYKYFSVVALVSILITGIIYHALLSDGQMDFNNHVVHTFTPVFYTLFYFLFIKPTIRLKDFWVTLIFPLIYFVVILIQGSFTNWYPYGFLNPTLPNASLVSVLMFCCLVLLPIFAVFTLVLVYLKALLEKSVKKEV